MCYSVRTRWSWWLHRWLSKMTCCYLGNTAKRFDGVSLDRCDQAPGLDTNTLKRPHLPGPISGVSSGTLIKEMVERQEFLHLKVTWRWTQGVWWIYTYWVPLVKGLLGNGFFGFIWGYFIWWNFLSVFLYICLLWSEFFLKFWKNEMQYFTTDLFFRIYCLVCRIKYWIWKPVCSDIIKTYKWMTLKHIIKRWIWTVEAQQF